MSIISESEILILAKAIVHHTERLDNPCNGEPDDWFCRYCKAPWETDRRYKKNKRGRYYHNKGCPTLVAKKLLKRRTV